MYKKQVFSKSVAAVLALTALCLVTPVQASVVALNEASFGAPQVTFSEVAAGTAINGLTINGFSFSETFSNTFVSAGGGPGDTNNISQSSALGNANPIGETITITMPELTSAFGFGYAILATGTIQNAVTINLFDGLNNVGALAFTGSSDPTFTGGFAGIASTIAFTSLTLTFSNEAAAFDFDNLRTIKATVPEPGSLALLCLGIAGLAVRRRRSTCINGR